MGFVLVKNSIVWDLTLNGKRFRIFTGLVTAHWLTKEQRVSKVEDFAWEKNAILEKLDSESARLKIRAKVEAAIPDRVFLEELVKTIRGIQEPKKETYQPQFAWELVQVYRDRMANLKSSGHLKNFKSMQDYLKKEYPFFRFSEMNYDWMAAFVNGLIDGEQEFLHNTIVRKVREIRTVANFSRMLGIEVHPESNLFKMSERKYHPFYLDWMLHVQVIEEIELADELDRIRDRFLFRCYTGMREGEMNQLNENNFFSKGNALFLRYQDIKGKKPKSIQLSPKAVSLAKKYAYQLPKCSQQHENRGIKLVMKAAKFTSQIDKIRHSGNRVKISHKILADMVSTHTARRTFARRWYEQGGDLLKLSKYLGHSSVAVTERYVGVEDEETNNEMIRVMS
jgi:integrase